MSVRLPKSARNVLNAKRVQSLNKAGMYADGGNLYLQVGEAGGKSWIFRYMQAGKVRNMGLGAYVDVSLAEARAEAADHRQSLRKGGDPLTDRRERIRQTFLAAREVHLSSVPFKDAAKSYIATKAPQWTDKHRKQWEATLETYAYPKIGKLPVADIDTEHVTSILEPIWTTKNETAGRVRGRIEAVLDWSTVKKYRVGLNPARWKGHLALLLADKKDKIAPKKHLASLPYAELQDFVAKVRAMPGGAARALELAILTAARTGEIIGAKWDEFDLEAGIWVVPGERMKSGREHRVPLSPTALSLLKKLPVVVDGGDWVFPGAKHGRALSNTAMLQLLKRMERQDITVHGFRSTFRDWAAEQTSYPNHVLEMALAHVIPDKTEAAYRRGDLFEKRAKLMVQWANYVASSPERDNVRELHRG